MAIDPSRRFWTIPNMLSLSRLAMLPVFWWLMAQPEGRYWVWGGVVIILGMLSDILDGTIARRFNQVTETGKLLDPLADKITAGFLAVFCVAERGMPIVALILTLARDLALLVGGRFLWKKGGKIPTSIFIGKIAALCWGLNLLIWVFDWQPYASYLLWPSVIFYVGVGALYARRAFTSSVE